MQKDLMSLGFIQQTLLVVLDLSSGLSEEVKVQNMRVRLPHGVMAFFAWGVLVPISVTHNYFKTVSPKDHFGLTSTIASILPPMLY
jgi:hypothetical protein